MMSVVPEITHHIVFRRPGSFAGWPANYGLWSWGDEILAVFAVGSVGPKGEIHELDRTSPFVPTQARSTDGGMTWVTETFMARVPGGYSLSADEHLEQRLRVGRKLTPSDLQPSPVQIDFLDPETILMCARTSLSGNAVSWFYISRTRGKSWDGPYAFTGLDLPIAARTDIVPLSASEALFMLTTTKVDGSEGRTFCARTRDGGRNFEFIGFIGDGPEGFRIMPSSQRMADGLIVTATRSKGADSERGWIEVYVSHDEGLSWACRGVAAGDTGVEGNPPALALLSDGCLALAYGSRTRPFGLRIRTSDNAGETWSEEFVVRSDAGTLDMGYPKIVKSGETLVVVYYFNDGPGQERYIAASRVMGL